MAIKIVPYGLLQLMIRRPFLEPLVEKVSQVLVQLSSCRKRKKQTEHINNRASQRLQPELCVGKPQEAILVSPPQSLGGLTLGFSLQGRKQAKM